MTFEIVEAFFWAFVAVSLVSFAAAATWLFSSLLKGRRRRRPQKKFEKEEK